MTLSPRRGPMPSCCPAAGHVMTLTMPATGGQSPLASLARYRRRNGTSLTHGDRLLRIRSHTLISLVGRAVAVPTFIDPKWLELLKASRPQAAALAVACFVLLAAPHWTAIPSLPDWVVIPAFFVGVLCSCLVVFSLVSSAYKIFPLHRWAVKYLTDRRSQKEVRAYIPFMTEKDKEIVAYLLHFNLKTIEADRDGGSAAQLISRGVLVVLLRPNQQVRSTNVPMIVPDCIWDVLQENKEQFPYTSPRGGIQQGPPWRIPWMAR